MARKKRHQADNRADLRGGGFIGLPRVVYKSAAYQSLNPFERAVFIEILAAFNGYNNGKIVISHRQIAHSLANSNFGKISKAIAKLIMRGLLGIRTESVWKERRAREYRLTFISMGCPPNFQRATNEYLEWKENDADKASATKGKAAEAASADGKHSADAVAAALDKNLRNAFFGHQIAADDVSAHID